MEARGFRDQIEAIHAAGAVLAGISADSAESHARFSERHSLPFPLIADPGRDIIRAYGVQRRLRFLPNKRVTYVIDKTGIVRGVFHHEIAIGKHVDEVIAGLRSL
jgi:peroxiredoxin Q/BCP